MPRQRYRGNNLSASFPLLSSFSGQSVIVPGIDQFYIRPNVFTGSEADKNIGIPQVIFMENVMPMTNGLQSVGFAQAISRTHEADFDKAFYLRDAEERKTLFVPANGKNYFYDGYNAVWKNQPEPVPFNSVCSAVNIKGRQFVCYANHSTFFEWNGSFLASVLFAGLDPTQIIGLVSANAYQIAFTEREIFWSSIDDPTDFVPSLETGAGGSDVLAIKGKIICCTPISDGFMIYTTANVIAASYSANNRFPFVFKEIAGSAGIEDCEKATNDESGIHQYAVTVTGLMVVDRNQALPIWPEISEFISGRRYELYNTTTKKVVEYDTNDALLTKINFIAERYLVLSYGDNELTHALVYDSGLKRWGKLMVSHVDCFEYVDQPVGVELGVGIRYKDIVGRISDQLLFYRDYGHLSLGLAISYQNLVGTIEEQTSTYAGYGGLPQAGVFISQGQEPYKSIGFLQKDGSVRGVNFDLPFEDINSILYLGRYQLSRSRFTELYELWVENADASLSLSVIPSFDGFNNEARVPCRRDEEVSKNRLQKFFCYESAMSFILQFEGKFQISSLEAVFGTAGYR